MNNDDDVKKTLDSSLDAASAFPRTAIRGTADRRDDSNKEAVLTTELEKKCQEYLNGWKRAQADYQNLVKESDQRRVDYVKFANANLIIELLPILDNFKTAFNQIPEVEKNSPWVIGFQYIKKQLEDFLTREGVEQIKTVGEEFDHELHEAVDNDLAENASLDVARDDIVGDEPAKQVIIKEVRPGYKLNNKVVQVAKVVVDKLG